MAQRLGVFAVGALLALSFLGVVLPAQSEPAVRSSEERAVVYLAAEAPRWHHEHGCYSCHNNGDAARALIAASARGHAIGTALDDTRTWLASPQRWNGNARRGGSEELPLARIQFASALASLVASGHATQDALGQAAALVSEHQHEDGSWRLSESQSLGGATFYGTALATAMARKTLAQAGTDAGQAPLAKANAWLRSVRPESVLDASSVLIGLDRDTDQAAVAQRQWCLDVLARGQGPDGGWGPYVTSQSEPFDTALAVLALTRVRTLSAPSTPSPEGRDLLGTVTRARGYLTDTQNPDGSWPETTRPPNGESYAQRISTTAWALLALLESGD